MGEAIPPPIDRPDVTTQFKTGNQAWKARSTHGSNAKFEEPSDLKNAIEQYFQWVTDNPLVGIDVAKFQGTGTLVSVPKMRAMSVEGACNFIGIVKKTWYNYKDNPDLLHVCEWAEQVMYQQKFEGASADLLNPAIIARELGLADKKEVEHKSGNLTHIESEYVDPEDGN